MNWLHEIVSMTYISVETGSGQPVTFSPGHHSPGPTRFTNYLGLDHVRNEIVRLRRGNL